MVLKRTVHIDVRSKPHGMGDHRKLQFSRVSSSGMKPKLTDLLKEFTTSQAYVIKKGIEATVNTIYGEARLSFAVIVYTSILLGSISLVNPKSFQMLRVRITEALTRSIAIAAP